MDKFMRYKEEQGAKGMTFHHVGDDEARAKLMKYSKRVQRPRWVSQPAERAGRRGARALQVAQAELDAREAALTAPQKMQRLKREIAKYEKAADAALSEAARKKEELAELQSQHKMSAISSKRKRT